MLEKITLSDQLEDRLIDFASRILHLVGLLPKTIQGHHIAAQSYGLELLGRRIMLRLVVPRAAPTSFTRCGLFKRS
jgi:hypothetical protein